MNSSFVQRQKQLVGDIAASSIKAHEPANTHINAKCAYAGYISLSRSTLVHMDYLGTCPQAGGLEIPYTPQHREKLTHAINSDDLCGHCGCWEWDVSAP